MYENRANTQKVILVNCEMCKYFDEHPFIRDGDNLDYCRFNEFEPTHPNNSCEHFVEKSDDINYEDVLHSNVLEEKIHKWVTEIENGKLPIIVIGEVYSDAFNRGKKYSKK